MIWKVALLLIFSHLLTVGLINVAQNSHEEFQIAKKFGNIKELLTHEAKVKEDRIHEMWSDLVAVENNIHIRRREQVVTEILDRLIGIQFEKFHFLTKICEIQNKR